MEDVVTASPAVQKDPTVQHDAQANRTHCVTLFPGGPSTLRSLSEQLSLDGTLLRLTSKKWAVNDLPFRQMWGVQCEVFGLHSESMHEVAEGETDSEAGGEAEGGCGGGGG